MIIFDTDHISLLQRRDSPKADKLRRRVRSVVSDEIVTTAITVEEQLRSWLSRIGQTSDVHQQTTYYGRLISLFEFFADWEILPFDNRAADEFTRLRGERVRIGTMDLKIAAIALVQDATLVAINLMHFEKVPCLRVEDWLND